MVRLKRIQRVLFALPFPLILSLVGDPTPSPLTQC
jgi:hypothetical protein